MITVRCLNRSGKWNIDARQLSRRYMPFLLVVLIATSLLTPVVFRGTIQWPLAPRVKTIEVETGSALKE